MGRGTLTKFNDSFRRYDECCSTIRAVRECGLADEDTLRKVVDLCNGSVIATSKFLHFLQPDAFAIWDSRVFAAIFEEKAHFYHLQNSRNFLAYVAWIRQVPIDSDTFDSVARYLDDNGNISVLRVKEFILFMSEK